MNFQLTRRGFIAGSLLLPVTQTSTKADQGCVTALPNEIAALIRRRDELLEKRRILDDRWKVAYEQMPEWSKPGRQFCDQIGSLFGRTVGWPPSAEPIAVDAHKFLVRPSPGDLRKVLVSDTRAVGKAQALESYRRRIGLLRSQLAERRQLARRIGLPQTADWLPIDCEIEETEAELGRNIAEILTSAAINRPAYRSLFLS